MSSRSSARDRSAISRRAANACKASSIRVNRVFNCCNRWPVGAGGSSFLICSGLPAPRREPADPGPAPLNGRRRPAPAGCPAPAAPLISHPQAPVLHPPLSLTPCVGGPIPAHVRRLAQFLITILQLVQFRVDAAAGQQLAVCPLLDDSPFVQDEDPVHVLNGGEPVGDDDGCPAAQHILQGLLDE